MQQDNRIERRRTRLGQLLLILLAVGMYWGGLVPARRAAVQQEVKVRQTRARLKRLELRIRRLRTRSDALKARDPAAVEEAIREHLRKGKRNDYMLQADPIGDEAESPHA